LSLVDIADAVGLEGSDAAKQAEKYVLKMVIDTLTMFELR